MQKKLQQFQKTFLKKQTSKLSLQIKLSLINSNYYEQTQTRSPKYSQSPTTRNSLSVKPFDTTERSNLTHNDTQQLQDRVEKLQHEVEKQFAMIQKFKQIFKERLAEYQNVKLCRQKNMKQLTLKRKIKIQTLKRQVKLTIKCNIEQREYLFQRLQSEFDRTVDEFFKTWKKMQKVWKIQLKTILEKFQGHQQSKSSENGSNTATQQSRDQVKNSLKRLQKQLKDHLISSQKESIKLQLELSIIIQNFQVKRQQLKEKLGNQLVQILDSIQKLQKSIKSEVKKEHLETEQNRQKLLLLFEQNIEKIQNEKLNKQRRSTNKYKPLKMEYRHLV